jgi:1,2-diacylglycerol 3-beta-galactosyltransferase
MPAIDFIYFDAGGGHRSAVTALREVIAEQRRPWETRLVNLQEVLDEMDPFRKLTGVRAQDVYNGMLNQGWTLGSAQLKTVYHGLIRLSHSAQVARLERHWLRSRPDLAVSVIPHFNRALAESLRNTHPGVPFVTILTDIADSPPHFWIERQMQHLVCGSARAVEQARRLGHPKARIWQTSGMIVHPRFYAQPEIDRRAERQRLGLHPDLPTALLLFGGQGSRAMLRIVQRMDAARAGVQAIALCGRNTELAAGLLRLHLRMPLHVVGFTAGIPYYMRLSDFLIGKPGPGCVSEAAVMGLPMIVESNSWTMPQERYNPQWILDQNFGLVVDGFSRVAPAVQELLRPANYRQFKDALAAHRNRAVFEIPEILDAILRESAAALPRNRLTAPIAASAGTRAVNELPRRTAADTAA